MSKVTQYTSSNQLDLSVITIKKPGSDSALEITDTLEEIIIHEDIFQCTLSAKLVFRDQVNLVGTLPIVGGEEVYIKFKSSCRAYFNELKLVVYKVGERMIPNDSSNMQVNILYLCTPEVWWAANNDIGNGFRGTYSDIVEKLLKLTGSRKQKTIEQTSGINTFVAPLWNVFKCLKWCCSRANSQSFAPFFFWETLKGYYFRSLKTMYDIASFKRVYIQDKNIMGSELEPERAFNSVYSYEYVESNDRLSQFSDMAFGGNVIEFDPITKKFNKRNFSYKNTFNTKGIHVEGFPLNDDMVSNRDKLGYVSTKEDDSHLGFYPRTSSLSLMDNVKLYISIPGDSDLESGHTIWMEIPAKVGLKVGKEEHTSGKWLVRSIKHLIQKTTYTQICELTKDSFAIPIRKD